MTSVRGRSHPPTLIRLVERTLRDECNLRRGERILLGVSGGGDSTALLHVLAFLASKMGFSLTAHGVDHGLRPEASGELDLAAARAAALGVGFDRALVECPAGGNVQARARVERRKALEAAAKRARATRIATAHHADDRAETVLIRLLHGASPAALAVLPPIDGHWIRPMIRARKSDVTAHLARHGLAHADDPSNRNPRFLRTRVRLELMPLLEDLSPSVVEHLTMLADDLLLGACPPLKDAAGRPVTVRRAHVREMRRAVALGKAVTIRVSGGVDLPFHPGAPKKEPRDRGAGRTRPPKHPTTRKNENGGAKTRKSG